MKRSEEFKELLKKVPEDRKSSREYVSGLYMLMCAYESEEDDKCVEVGRMMIDTYFDLLEEKELRMCFDVLARHGDFESFMIAMEWNRPMEKKFYIPRAKVLKKHGLIDALQGIEDGKYDLVVLNMPPRTGKLLSDDTPILTRNGWKSHGELVVGDEVLNHKGEFVHVLGVSEKSKAEYRVRFSNGEEIDCHGNHEWVVYDRHALKEKIIETKEMVGKVVDDYKHKSDNGKTYRFYIPIRKSIIGEYKDLPVKPYTLGVWLGDGTNQQAYVTLGKDKINVIDGILDDGYVLKNKWEYNNSFKCHFDGLKCDLNKIDMCFSDEKRIKHIPDEYLTASVEQRLELLAGLLDSDGCRQNNRYKYTTTDKTLCDNVVSLINTFGWRTSVTTEEPSVSINHKTGKEIIGRKLKWSVWFNPTFIVPCRCPKKQIPKFSTQKRLSIVSIEPLQEEKYGNCIQVEGGIYLAGRQLIPTHNSTLSMFFLTFRAGLYPEQSILGNGHSTSLTQSFYREFVNMVTSDEYRFGEIFPNITLTTKNAEYSYLDFNTDKRFHTVSFRSIDAGTTGLSEASNLLYCDDMIKDVETANSKDRLDKLYHNYTSTVKDRKVTRLCKDGVYRSAPELHVATNWSIYDITTRVIENEITAGNEDRVCVIKVPCWDENRESNFMYECGKGFDTKYYEEMELAEDPVIFSAKYLAKPIERDGHPFEKDSLIYFDELPVDENGETKKPDRIIAYNDVAHGGDDFMSMPIAYVYGMDIYIVDVLFMHNFPGDGYSRPLVCKKIIDWGIQSCGFEKANGGDFYQSLIHDDLVEKGYRCNTMAFNVPNTKSKLDRILSCQNEIHGDSLMIGCMRVLFRNPKTMTSKGEYLLFLENLWNWSQKNGTIQKRQHDDAPDSLAGLLINMLGKRNLGGFGLYDIRDAGY